MHVNKHIQDIKNRQMLMRRRRRFQVKIYLNKFLILVDKLLDFVFHIHLQIKFNKIKCFSQENLEPIVVFLKSLHAFKDHKAEAIIAGVLIVACVAVGTGLGAYYGTKAPSQFFYY